MVAALTAAAILAPAGAASAEASCTTVIVLGQKTCLESISCRLRDHVASQDPRVQAIVAKYGAYDCIQ
jgi:hypothetical protein